MAKSRPPTERPDPVDVEVGARIRLRRALMGMSQQTLAERLGITFQQIQKYERGTNRVGASRLYEMAGVLDTSVGFFFPEEQGGTAAGLAEPDQAPFDSDPLTRRETVELIEAYYAIENADVRRRLLELARALSAGVDPPNGNGTRRLPRRRRA